MHRPGTGLTRTRIALRTPAMPCSTSTSSRTAAVRLALVAGPDAPGRARAAVAELGSSLDARERHALELVASELVTNSVRHSGAQPGQELELAVQAEPRVVRLAVHDPGAGFDLEFRSPTRGRIGGWGLALVAELVDRWWVESGPPTRVVCELDR